MENIVLKVKDFSAYYGDKKIVKNINLVIKKNKVTSIMGPSGCGKTTFIRCINRMHEVNVDARITGKIFLHDNNICEMDPIIVRRKIGMVFQRPNPFPNMSIYDNVIAGYKLNGIKLKREEFDEIVEDSLKKAGLWYEVKSDLYRRSTFLSGGQQQRLCIARSLAMKPDILLLDEPTSALDPIATKHIEKLIEALKENVTIIIVTHNLAQAGRVSDYVAFMYLGELIEFGKAEKIFTAPEKKETEKFLIGKIG